MALIKKFKAHGIIAIKISPHFHDKTSGLKFLYSSAGYIIAEETNASGQKDSSKMLKAGAEQVFYMMVNDDSLEDAFMKLMSFVPDHKLLICESGWLRKVVVPEIFILTGKQIHDNAKPHLIDILPYADFKTSNYQEIDSLVNEIQTSNNRWLRRPR